MEVLFSLQEQTMAAFSLEPRTPAVVPSGPSWLYWRRPERCKVLPVLVLKHDKFPAQTQYMHNTLQPSGRVSDFYVLHGVHTESIIYSWKSTESHS